MHPRTEEEVRLLFSIDTFFHLFNGHCVQSFASESIFSFSHNYLYPAKSGLFAFIGSNVPPGWSFASFARKYFANVAFISHLFLASLHQIISPHKFPYSFILGRRE